MTLFNVLIFIAAVLSVIFLLQKLRSSSEIKRKLDAYHACLANKGFERFLDQNHSELTNFGEFLDSMDTGTRFYELYLSTYTHKSGYMKLMQDIIHLAENSQALQLSRDFSSNEAKKLEQTDVAFVALAYAIANVNLSLERYN